MYMPEPLRCQRQCHWPTNSQPHSCCWWFCREGAWSSSVSKYSCSKYSSAVTARWSHKERQSKDYPLKTVRGSLVSGISVCFWDRSCRVFLILLQPPMHWDSRHAPHTGLQCFLMVTSGNGQWKSCSSTSVLTLPPPLGITLGTLL